MQMGSRCAPPTRGERCRCTSAVAALLAALGAAGGLGAPSSAWATPPPVDPSFAPDPTDQGLVDYNAPARGRTIVNHGRAFAAVTGSSWAIWQYAWLQGKDWTTIDRHTIRSNLTSGFVFDQDELQTNFFGHPYHGGFMFTSARAAGLSFWESVPYAVGGSLTWELFAESEPPSANDFVVTTLGGIMLGEILYRLSSEMLDDRSRGGARLARELGAAAVSPMRGLNRAVTGQAWADGPGGRRTPTDLSLQLGWNWVRATGNAGQRQRAAAALVSTEVRYGTLTPARGETTLKPFEYFDFFAALSALSSRVHGVQVYSKALLFGAHAVLSSKPGPRDENVVGVAMTYEFDGANVWTFGDVGVGPANITTLRFGRGPALRFGTGLDVVPILGLTRDDEGSEERDYNFGMGGAGWASLDVDVGQFGIFRARTRHILTSVVDGTGGADYVGSTRVSYQVDAVRNFGIGVAPRVLLRRSIDAGDHTDAQFETQVFLNIHN